MARQTVIFTGKTFEHRELLKSYGARYDGNLRRWTFVSSDIELIERITSTPMPGVKIELLPAQQPTPAPITPPMSASGTAERTDPKIISTVRGARLNARPLAPTTMLGDTIMLGNCDRFYNRFKGQNPLLHMGFDSLADLIEYIETYGAKDTATSAYSRAPENCQFSGTPSMDHAMQLATDGWQHGADKIAEYIDMLNVDRPKARRRQHHVTGGHVNVGRLLNGHPMHMVRRAKQPNDKVVTVFIETGATRDIEANSMLHRAAAVGAIVDKMEAEGYRCEIVMCSNPLPDARNEDGTPRAQWNFTCTVKRAQERLSLHALAFALGHPSFHRRFRFAVVDSRPELSNWHLTQGSSSVGFDDTHPTRPNVEFYIPRIWKNTYSPVHAMRAILPEGLPIKIITD